MAVKKHLIYATTLTLILFAAHAYPEEKNAANTEQLASGESQSAQSQPVMLAAAIGSEFLNKNPKISQSTVTKLPEDENSLRLLEAHISKYKLDDLIATYQYKDMIFVPLGFLSELIDLAIRTDPTTGIAQGYIFDENRQFYLDVQRGEITIDGKLQQFDKQRVAVRELDDIYVDSYLLSKWLPLKLDIDLYSSQLKIIPDKPLPFQLRKKREEKIERVRSRESLEPRDYPKQIESYRDWSHPLINQSARVGFIRNASGEFEKTYGYTTYVTADLFRMESDWYLSGSEQDLAEDFRVTFARRDPAGSLLGKMKATEYAIGHINEPRLELVTKPIQTQPGVYAGNFPLARQIQFDSQNFRGPLPPGWQVELYRNNDLLDFQSASTDGQYIFDDVPLLFGQNYFRLVFYGPQGQQREETFTYNLDRSLTIPYTHQYRALVTHDNDFGTRTMAQYDYGISQYLTVATSLASIPLRSEILLSRPEETHNYLTAGLRGFNRIVFYRLDMIEDMQSGSAFDWELQTRWGNAIIKGGETYFVDDFISEEFPVTASPIERRSLAKLDMSIPTSFAPRIPVTFEYERDAYAGGFARSLFTNRVSVQAQGFNISNTINLNRQSGLNDVVSGDAQISRRAFGYNFRGAFNYQLDPESQLSAATFTLDGFRLWNYHIATGFTRAIQSDTDQLFFSANRTHGAYALGFATTYSTGGVLSFNLTFNIGLGHEPRTGAWIPEYRPIATQGAMSVRVFLDKNLNGIKDEDEETIPGIKIRINGGNMPGKSDNNGILYVTGLEPYRELDVDIALETLEDPLWQPATKGKRISLRPGHVAQIDFPILITGEVDGTVAVQFGEEAREVSGVIIELLDMQGNIVQTAKTAYDGFYLLTKLPIGKYQLRISRDQTDSLNLLPVEPTFVIVEPENPIVNGMDFVLQKQFSK